LRTGWVRHVTAWEEFKSLKIKEKLRYVGIAEKMTSEIYQEHRL
jgi:hypothetical protein